MMEKAKRSKAPSSTVTLQAPTQAEDGDALLVLVDQITAPVHSQLLVLKSPILRDAVHLALQQTRSANGKLRIPLNRTTVAETNEMLALLYSSKPESHILGLPLEKLQLLCNICHYCNFADFLPVIDQALARRSGDSCPKELVSQVAIAQCLRPENAAELYWYARTFQLDHFQAACAHYIGSHVREVAEATPTDALGPVLAHVAVSAGSADVVEELELELQQIMQLFSVSTSSPSGYSSGSHQKRLCKMYELVKRLSRA